MYYDADADVYYGKLPAEPNAEGWLQVNSGLTSRWEVNRRDLVYQNGAYWLFVCADAAPEADATYSYTDLTAGETAAKQHPIVFSTEEPAEKPDHLLSSDTYSVLNTDIQYETPFIKAGVEYRVQVDVYGSYYTLVGVEGQGGYEGQYSLSSQRPFIIEMEIREIVKNPLESEGSEVDSFCAANGSQWLYTKEGDEEGSSKIPAGYDDENHPYKLREKGYRWVSACDSVAQVYVDVCYDPTKASDYLNFNFPVRSEKNELLWDNKAYDVGFEPYNGSDLEARISEALKKRFHADEEYKHPGLESRDADSVGMDGESKIWYIARMLDGFIYDTNIDEVKEIIYGEADSEGSALTYTPDEDQSSQISAYYYVVPNLCYGQWAEFVTVSTQGYGATGRTGSTTTSGGSTGYSSSYLDYLNYYNYYNSYYGNSYYGSYYNNYYYNYLNSYYYNYGYGYGDTTTETTTTISTEIPPYTPLVYQIYIEPAEGE